MKKASSDTQQRRSAQTGSTLLGIIIGLIVGLAIAVVVALVITKGNSPFTNKLGKTERASESASAPLIDPNKPLYGNREPAKEAAKEFAPESAPTPAPTAQATPAATPAPQAAADPNKAKPAVTPTPAPQAAASPAPGATPQPAANPEEKWIYYLQAGAFRDQADAEKTRANLALLGFEAAISERNSDNGVLYRVRLGPFNQVEAMNRARAKLSENGVDVSVVRNQK
ncbi:SPOR domain-containing protein [Massilia sp. W12]|uniref:SPOR domain-containing protein n=1 Tax=Massilia sp. W12 TaxID=3126507 RepID=UPI0030D41A59